MFKTHTLVWISLFRFLCNLFHYISFVLNLMALAACALAVVWADNCVDKCQVMCVFPSSTCMALQPCNQSACMEDYPSCVSACTKKCECRLKCKGNSGAEFDLCVTKCLSETVATTVEVLTTVKPTESSIVAMPGILLTGEDGHLE
ncbi:hypothetical protein EGW08_003442 [Elysia chlorotica]|uniref:Uncharacterized protein n=1 Tax=Elysia chlorotica TaxID=188477 RepID=A0A433U4R2_ELYCH|nr:hypothetical protein EGW08_003442 [Elysia chlorotica]